MSRIATFFSPFCNGPKTSCFLAVLVALFLPLPAVVFESTVPLKATRLAA